MSNKYYYAIKSLVVLDQIISYALFYTQRYNFTYLKPRSRSLRINFPPPQEVNLRFRQRTSS